MKPCANATNISPSRDPIVLKILKSSTNNFLIMLGDGNFLLRLIAALMSKFYNSTLESASF